MTWPEAPVDGTNGAGRFASGVEPEAPGGWKGRIGVLGEGDNIILLGKKNPKDKLI